MACRAQGDIRRSGRFQAAVELLVEMVDNQAKANIHNAQSRKFIAPLTDRVRGGSSMMNAMDMLPVDLLPVLWQGFQGDARLCASFPADLSTTLGLSSAVLILCFFYSIQDQGHGRLGHELVTAPFGTSKESRVCAYPGCREPWPCKIIEYVAKTVSHGCATVSATCTLVSLVFCLIAPDGRCGCHVAFRCVFPLGHIIAGSIWAIFHILITPAGLHFS